MDFRRANTNVAALYGSVAGGSALLPNWSTSANLGTSVTSFNTTASGNPIASGDLICILVTVVDTSGTSTHTIAAPGFTATNVTPAGSNQCMNVAMLYKIAGGSESGAYAVTIGTGGANFASGWLMFTVTGVHQTTPINAIAGQGSGGAANTVSIVAPTITPNRADTTLYSAYFVYTANPTKTYPGGQTQRAADVVPRIFVATEYTVAASATGTRTLTLGSADAGAAFNFAVSPP